MGGIGVAPKPRLCNLPFVQMGLRMASSQSRPTHRVRKGAYLGFLAEVVPDGCLVLI